jgi:hypothetical protein
MLLKTVSKDIRCSEINSIMSKSFKKDYFKIKLKHIKENLHICKETPCPLFGRIIKMLIHRYSINLIQFNSNQDPNCFLRNVKKLL